MFAPKPPKTKPWSDIQDKEQKKGAHINLFKVEEVPASWQVGLWMIARSLFERYPASLTPEEVCRRVGIGRSSAYAACAEISRRILFRSAKPSETIETNATHGDRGEMKFEIAILRYERDHPGCRGSGEVRSNFTSGYKECVENARAQHGVPIKRASEILSIPEDTLKKFSRFTGENSASSRSNSGRDASAATETLPSEVVALANEYLRSGRRAKSVKDFFSRHPELLQQLKMTYRQALSWLRELGLASPRGIFLKNTGLDRIIRFKPHQVWASDGKQLTVIINGEIFTSVWQCLVDGATTAIVGGVVRDQENTENLVEALKRTSKETGKKPMAIVLDNRLSENLPAVRSYFEENGIEIIKTFPGNSKSNGIAEENFNVFERWVGGTIEINGRNMDEIARSIQEAFVEVFTQMRNHKPRRGLSMKTVTETMNETPPATPEEEAAIREKIKALADRFKNEQAKPFVSEQKKSAIAQAIRETSPPQPDVFEKRLQSNARFTPDLILSSLAILKNKRQENPEKSLGHAYYGGILRSSVDQRALEDLNKNLESVYAHHWDTMGKLNRGDLALSLKTHPEETCQRLSNDFIHMPIQAFATYVLMDLKDAFIAAARGSAALAEKLRKSIAETAMKSRRAINARRESLLKRVFEWENFVRMADREAEPYVVAPAGNA